MPFSKARQTRRIFYNARNQEARRFELQKAIERSTGIPISMLKVIEKGMEERTKHPILSSVMNHSKRMPSSQKIIARLLSAPLKKGKKQRAENLFTEYRVSLSSSKTKVEIVAYLKLFRKTGFLGMARSHGVITVKYVIKAGDRIHEYRQDFLLSRKNYVTARHSALDYNQTVPRQWRKSLTPQLLAPPSTIYL